MPRTVATGGELERGWGEGGALHGARVGRDEWAGNPQSAKKKESRTTLVLRSGWIGDVDRDVSRWQQRKGRR